MKILLTILLSILLINLSQSRTLWSGDLPEISRVALNKGTPIPFVKSYNKLQLCDLNGTIFTESLSQLTNLTALRICRSNIQKLEPEALCSSPVLKTLELDFYGSHQLPKLSKKVFKNCSNVEELLFKFNIQKTSSLENNALENFPKLKRLYFQGFNLSRLGKNFLSLPNQLTVLVFSVCNIQEIDPDAFEGLNDLEELTIIHNRDLKVVPTSLFQKTPKLKKLILRDNGIENLTWDEFEGLNNLKTLSLAENRISSFNARKISRNLPNLKAMSIELNPPTCRQREAFVNELRSKLNKVVVTYKFDPGLYDSCEDHSEQ